jgi:hypothetical protein
MFYHIPVTSPLSTLETDPTVQDFTVGLGIIDFIEVEFPAGCVGLVHAKILYNTVQIVPYNPSQALYGDDRVFHLPMNYRIDVPPYDLRFIVWNEDDTYQHTVAFGVMMKDLAGLSIAQVITGA